MNRVLLIPTGIRTGLLPSWVNTLDFIYCNQVYLGSQCQDRTMKSPLPQAGFFQLCVVMSLLALAAVSTFIAKGPGIVPLWAVLVGGGSPPPPSDYSRLTSLDWQLARFRDEYSPTIDIDALADGDTAYLRDILGDARFDSLTTNRLRSQRSPANSWLEGILEASAFSRPSPRLLPKRQSQPSSTVEARPTRQPVVTIPEHGLPNRAFIFLAGLALLALSLRHKLTRAHN